MFTKNYIINDLNNIAIQEFYLKYLLRSDNWYFEKVLGIEEKDIIHSVDDFKMLVSQAFDISFNNVVMVGSAKLGFSIAPENSLRDFIIDGESPSDIDIAIISPQLFDYFWRLFRKSYSIINKRFYKYISRGIYRGYISDIDLKRIDECREVWIKNSSICTKSLQQNMYFRHEIHYRIYRDWKDLEEYHIQSLEQLKEELKSNG